MAGMSQMVSEDYRYNTSCITIFSKPLVRKRLEAHIRTIVVLTCGKLSDFYFLHLLYRNYYSVMTHLRSGKKVSILLPGDVNPGPVPSRRGLIENSPYHMVGVACLSCNCP
jgi:hypothetical protein